MNIYDNKPKVIPTWQLQICINMGRYVDDQWVTDNTLQPFDIEIYYDNLKLDLGSIIGTHHFNFEDTTEFQEHSLKIVVSNVTEQQWQDLLRCQLFVEDVDIGYIVENSASYVTEHNIVNCGTDFIGENGVQTLKIQTPVYRWLFDHENDILSKLRNTV